MKLYRYERGHYNSASLDEPVIFLDSYDVIAKTKCGYWIEDFTGKRWVSSTGKKRYAYRTKEEAYVQFIARTKRCIVLLKAQLRQAEGYASVKQPEHKEDDPNDYDEIC